MGFWRMHKELIFIYCDDLLGIEILKKEMLRWKGQEKGPVMVEFLQSKGNLEAFGGVNEPFDISEKKSWMSSVHLWSTPVHYEEDDFDTRNQDSVFHQESVNPLLLLSSM